MPANEQRVCPRCHGEFAQSLSENVRAATHDQGNRGVDTEGDIDDPEKKAYCCPMCGYESPDPDAFVPLS
jgi:hypothetical protein